MRASGKSFLSAAALATLVAFAHGCGGTEPLAPAHASDATAAAPLARFVGTVVAPVERRVPLAREERVTQLVDARGATLTLRQAGLQVTFAPGAVSGPTAITLTALAGAGVSYSFEPHGLQFAAPVFVRQELRTLRLTGGVAPTSLFAAYFSDESALDPAGDALVLEAIPVTLDLGTLSASFPIRHFSGYMVSTGKGGTK